MTFHELADFVLISRNSAVHGLENQLIICGHQRIENAALHVHNILWAGVVVCESDQEGLSERKRAGLRVGSKAVLGDYFFDPFARFRTHKR